MAAGMGTRLMPLTSVVPKPALPVGNEPVMGRLLRLLAHNGVRNVAVNASHLADVMQLVFGDGSPWGVHIDWSIEERPHGTAGGVREAREFLDDGSGAPILVLSGDGLHEFDLAGIIASHRLRGALVTIGLIAVDDPSGFGVAVLDADGRIDSFQEKPDPADALSDLANTGVYVIDPRVLDEIPAEGDYDFGSQLFPAMVERRDAIYGFEFTGYWNDIGTLDAYLEANLDVANGIVGNDGPDDGVMVAASARLEPSAKLTGPVVVGQNCHVEAGARLERSVVLPGTDIPADSEFVGELCADTGGMVEWLEGLATV
jgi:NDP-sugar pyrophosphorylase family protein